MSRRSDLAFRLTLAAAVAAMLAAAVWRSRERTAADDAIRAAESRAGETHTATLARMPSLADDEARAEALADGPLPLWRHALTTADAAGADIAAHRLHLRVLATETLIDALRTGDEQQLRRAEHAWAEAEKTGRIDATTDRRPRLAGR